MKNIFKLIVMVVLTGLAACTDLDLKPKSTTTNSVVFNDPSSYRAFIARVYAGLAISGQQGPAGDPDIKGIDEGFSNYIRQYWVAQELTTDEAVISWNDEGLPAMHEQTWTASNQFITAMYNRIFFQVSMANEFLRETTDEKLNSRGVSDALKTQIKAYRAEARFLSALSYWHGIDLFANIPFYTEDQLVGKSAPDQASRSTVFSFIESELNDIENDMIAPQQNEYGRADRAALWMLQANLFLNAQVYTGQERYTDCITACKKILDASYSLAENYQDNFRADNNNSPEIIFAVPYDGQNTQNWGGMTFVIHASIGGNMNSLNYGVNNGWGGTRTTSVMVNLFPDVSGNVDSRAIFYTDGQTEEINDIKTFTDGYAVPKFTNLTVDGEMGSNETFVDTDFPLFRLADAYLMYAEAVVRGGSGGDMATAVNLINKLRKRAYGDNTGDITANDLTLDFILNERSRELYWEGHRRTDLIRFGQFTENGIWPWKGGVKEGQTTEVYRNLFPLPSSDLIANPKLRQNEGYAGK